MKLYFAGCARDCADVVAANILALLAIGENAWCDDITLFVAENSSKDNTRQIISQLADQDDRVVPVFLDHLDEIIPVREARIAFCRDRLLAKIGRYAKDGLYVPIDLDSDIASSLQTEHFREACQLVISGRVTGVFPSSSPYYYDIHALRHHNWCSGSCLQQIQDAKARGALCRLLVYNRYLSSRQKPHARLQAQGLIPVDSAFGGVGIYCLTQVMIAGARYSSSKLDLIGLKLCEHVIFNGYFDRLFIYPGWVITAPPEHIEFVMLPLYRKVWRFIRLGLGDVRRFVSKSLSGLKKFL